MKGWSCYPIWGLAMSENGHGLEQPVFGDATIVSPSFIRRWSSEQGSAADIMGGDGFERLFEESDITSAGPAPVENLVSTKPTAFIAVRRKAPEDALRYAESIRALLTASCVLTSGTTKGFALTPIPLQWSPIPSHVRLDDDEKLAIDYRVVASNFIHLTPLVVSHRALRNAWETGQPVMNSWRLHKEDALSKVLVGDGRRFGGLGKRIRDAAATLARAMESTDTCVSTLFAAVAIEGLLRDNRGNFEQIEQMASCIFTSTLGPPEIQRLFSNRHKVAHEAAEPVGGISHIQEIGAAWGVILLAAMAAESVTSTDEFLRHMRGRVLARQMATQLRENGRHDLAAEVEEAATHIGPLAGADNK